MAYTREERLDIGKQVYFGEITQLEAMQKYSLAASSIQNYVTAYKKENDIPLKFKRQKSQLQISSFHPDLEVYQSMSKEELIQELIIAKANELRAKKGYEVKGVGQKKEFISLNNKSSK